MSSGWSLPYSSCTVTYLHCWKSKYGCICCYAVKKCCFAHQIFYSSEIPNSMEELVAVGDVTDIEYIEQVQRNCPAPMK